MQHLCVTLKGDPFSRACRRMSSLGKVLRVASN
jgi:hypothetical protein